LFSTDTSQKVLRVFDLGSIFQASRGDFHAGHTCKIHLFTASEAFRTEGGRAANFASFGTVVTDSVKELKVKETSLERLKFEGREWRFTPR